ncbi:hypothetical protein SAMN05660284_02528 [Formivibrio citricus]|uniref:Uncharacterized protein n=1 Tax=Formivibrio citricus TaxID=83765 RepID=A0A1I5CZS5_9NEIS|nr:hypothetical protein [Formivibrio citricus]SFN92387.1 hypothetical protein SAMN05660284_02528 [Formivibrio citricus]
MKIIDSQVALGATRSFQRSEISELTFHIDYASLRAQAAERQAAAENSEQKVQSLRFKLAQKLMQLLFAACQAERGKAPDGQAAAAAKPAAPSGNALPLQPLGGKVTLIIDSVITETESACYSACGRVKTADGREISFASQIELARSSRSETHGEIAMLDPLVLNYAAASASLAGQTFNFDLDADGDQEAISQLHAGSAFLALDKNADGKIGDGGELFGATSGDGFADLAQYDGDHNGWIDEGDSVYAQLKLWLKDDSGQDKLASLKDMGIGAIYLDQARADFTLQDKQQQTRGKLRASGVYLTEAGQAGSIQQLDLAA